MSAELLISYEEFARYSEALISAARPLFGPADPLPGLTLEEGEVIRRFLAGKIVMTPAEFAARVEAATTFAVSTALASVDRAKLAADRLAALEAVDPIGRA